MSARQFHKTTGIEYFFDAKALGTNRIEPDSFYYDAAAEMIAQQRRQSPMFMFVYLAANHYPWTDRWRPELMPEWQDLGNPPTDRRISAPPGDECARLREVPRAAEKANFPTNRS